MALILEVENGGQTDTAEVDLDLTEEEFLEVGQLVGGEAVVKLALGQWTEETARAILFVKLAPGCDFEDFFVEWPDELRQPIKGIEDTLGMEVRE